MSDGNKLNYN